MSKPQQQKGPFLPQGADAPFHLIPTDQLRAQEREIWDKYPDDMTHHWRLEDNTLREHQEGILNAQRKELEQLKKSQTNNLHLKIGNLLYPATVDEVRATLG